LVGGGGIEPPWQRCVGPLQARFCYPPKRLVDARIREAIALQFDALRAHGDPVPDPTTTVDVDAPITAAS
jgi:hypothetical protein